MDKYIQSISRTCCYSRLYMISILNGLLRNNLPYINEEKILIEE